jgi:uncharacterized membrane protein
VAAEFILQVNHITGEGMAVYLIGFLLLVVLAYLVVLAVAASQVAVAEKNSSRPPAAGEDRLLSMVVAEGGYDGHEA